MVQVLLTLVILTLAQDAPTGRYPEATEVFHCAMSQAADEDFDQWPDGWTRRRGPGYPHYVKVEIQSQSWPQGDRCLVVELDGGAAVASSPPIPIDPLFSCVLEVYVRTQGLKHDHALVSITFLNEKREPLETVRSETWGDSLPWTKVRLGPVSPRHDQACYAVVNLHVEPAQPGHREDLRGTAAFADVWLGRLPRMTLSTGNPSNLFTDPAEVEVTCTTSGFPNERPEVRLELEDVLARQVCETKRPTEPIPVNNDAKRTVGVIRWRPPLSGHGFYRVRATVKGREALYQRTVPLAVVEPLTCAPGSEFGWNLPRGEEPLGWDLLAALVAQAGIRWVKLPLWYPPDALESRAASLVDFQDRVARQGIEIVGVLAGPPEEVRKRLGDVKLLTAADVFGGPQEAWYPQLEPVMTRLAGQVRWWQLGCDRDLSFVGYPDLANKLHQVRAALGRLGGEINLGIGWDWLNQFPSGHEDKPSWQFLSLSADPPLTAEELSEYLQATTKSRLQRWVDLEPLPRRRFPQEIRAADLVRRMVVAKIHKVDAVIVPEPFSTEHGLMNDDGTLGELFLPWRTAALLLGGAQPLGSVGLPAGSRNYVFSRGDDAVMVAWGDRPAEEVLYLGEKVRVFDLWGRGGEPPRRANGQAFVAGPLPVFVTGVHEPIARWRSTMTLASGRLPSLFGSGHENSLRLKNSFSQGVTGRAAFAAPPGWTIEPREVSLRLARGETLQQPFRITLPPDATGGRYCLRIDFEVNADQPYRFSGYRQVDVGFGDVYIETRTQLNPNGELEVEQRLVNDTNRPLTFRCQLFAPNRQRQRCDILNLGPGRDVRVYHLSRGEELIGRTLWLRAEEIGGARILNYRFTAER